MSDINYINSMSLRKQCTNSEFLQRLILFIIMRIKITLDQARLILINISKMLGLRVL
jgi:hypothetical protein